MRTGLISDTHGMLRPEVFDHFQGVDHIVHAGDIGSIHILDELAVVAPVTAVWGNTDGFDVRSVVSEEARLAVGGHTIAIVHGHQLGSPAPATVLARWSNADVVVFGHTHRPIAEWHDGRLAVNPGAAGPARFRIRPSIAILSLDSARPRVDFIEL